MTTPLKQPNKGIFIANPAGLRPLFYVRCRCCKARVGPYRSLKRAQNHLRGCSGKG